MVDTRASLSLPSGKTATFHSLPLLEKGGLGRVSRLPVSLRIVPPGFGICHQVNLEFLSRGVLERGGVLYPDTLVGTDSHTTMVNGLGVLGWGVGGIEAEAAMLGQPMSMLIPQVVGFKLTGRLPEGATATDLVLTVTGSARLSSTRTKRWAVPFKG